MKFSRLVLLLLMAFVPIFPAAAAKRVPAKRTAGVAGLLRKVQQRYRIPSFQVEFSQAYFSATFGAEDEARGVVQVSRGRMVWTYSEPAGQLGAFDGEQYWLIVPRDKQVILRKRGPGEQDPLTELLTGRLDLARVFNVQMAEKQPGGQRVALLLTPKAQREDLDRALIELDPRDGTLRRLEVLDPLGNRMVFQLGVPKACNPPGDSAFTLTIPPGFSTVQD